MTNLTGDTDHVYFDASAANCYDTRTNLSTRIDPILGDDTYGWDAAAMVAACTTVLDAVVGADDAGNHPGPYDIDDILTLEVAVEQLSACIDGTCTCTQAARDDAVERIAEFWDRADTQKWAARRVNGPVVRLPGQSPSARGFCPVKDGIGYKTIDARLADTAATVTHTTVDPYGADVIVSYEMLGLTDLQLDAYMVLSAKQGDVADDPAWQLVYDISRADELTLRVTALHVLHAWEFSGVDQFRAHISGVVDELRSRDEALALELASQNRLDLDELLTTVRRLTLTDRHPRP